MFRMTRILLLLLLIMLPRQIVSQDTMHVRPRVGLALSGGGARGLAHIGVLKVMEEAGLKPDYISGVSMGSIIGAMYAMGYSADSLISMLKSTDWNLLLSDRIPENRIIFPEKKHFYNSIVSLPVTRQKIRLPTGLISGQQIENALGYYFWPAATVSDFSKLPVPFLCISTDVGTGQKVVLKNGYLPDAIRASIAIPTLLTPVILDSMLLVDGGVVHNYAATELRDMGADIIIGSYTGYRQNSVETSESAYGIMKRIIFISSFASFEKEKRETDILIEPSIKDYPTLAFDNNVDTIITAGYREALKYKNRFRRLADSLDKIGPGEPLKPLPPAGYYVFDRIEVKGNSITGDDQITGVLGISPGDTVTREMLSDGMELLYGKAWFEKVTYRITPRKDSLILGIECIERPRVMLYGALHYDLALGTGVLLSLSGRNLVTPRSVIDLDSYIGEYYRYRLSIMQFIDRGQRFGIEAWFFADKTNFPLISLRGETGPMLGQNAVTRLSLNQRLSLNHMMNLSFSWENQRLYTDYLSDSRIDRLSYDYLKLSYSYKANTLNFKHFPDKGITYNLSASASKLIRGIITTGGMREIYVNGDETDFSFERFFTLKGSFRAYTSPGPKLTLSFGGEALLVTNADSVTSNNNFYFLGGTDPVTDRSVPAIGFHENQIAVSELAGIRLGTDIEILTDLHVCLTGNFFAIKEPDREKGFSLLGGYGLGLGYMTVAGPIRAGVMYGIYNREVFFKPLKGYVSIGFSF
jgi:NTE family protein